MNSEPPLLALKQTNVSRPQLQHTYSKQSIAASEDYFSFESVEPSSDSDDRSKITAIRRYQTPPERTSPEHHEQMQSEATIPELNEAAQPAITFKNTPIIHQPPSPTTTLTPSTYDPRQSTRYSKMESITPNTTPGVDDTPYIRFAIDQLTRDEEVRGSRHYAAGPNKEDEDEEDYPVERLIDDQGMGYMSKQQRREASVTGSPVPLPPRFPPPVKTASKPLSWEPLPPRPEGYFQFATSFGRRGGVDLNFLPSILRPTWLMVFLALLALMIGLLLACAVISGTGNGLFSYQYFGGGKYFVLEYLPTMLGMIVLLWLFQIQIALQRVSLFNAMAYQVPNAINMKLYPTQFLFPAIEHFGCAQTMIGIFMVVAWLIIFTVPLLASAFNVRFYGTPSNGHWMWVAVQPIVGVVLGLYVLLFMATVALMVFLMGIRKKEMTGLMWDPRSIADIITMVADSNIVSDFQGSETWETHEFRNNLWKVMEQPRQTTGATGANRYPYRVGFWTADKSGDSFYAIGQQDRGARSYIEKDGRLLEVNPRASISDLRSQMERRPADFTIRLDIRQEAVRYRYLPWFLNNSAVVGWILIALALLIAWLVVSFLNDAVIQGFLPKVGAASNSVGFSASNFLYSFIPSFIGLVLFLFWFSIDMTLRGLAPMAALSRQDGATAEESLLVDYTARLPFSITLAALANRHYRVAAASLLTLCAAPLPVLAGGCFWTQYYVQSAQVRVAAHTPGYHGLSFFLTLHALSYFLLPARRRALALPHRAQTLAELLSWLYMSPALVDRAFAQPPTKPELVTRLVGPAARHRPSFTNLVSASFTSLRDLRALSPDSDRTTALPKMRREEKERVEEERARAKAKAVQRRRQSVLDPGAIRYAFGIYMGRDGQEHLGIDRLSRGSMEMVVLGPGAGVGRTKSGKHSIFGSCAV